MAPSMLSKCYTTEPCYNTFCLSTFCFDTEPCYVTQASLELILETSICNLPASASSVTRVTVPGSSLMIKKKSAILGE